MAVRYFYLLKGGLEPLCDAARPIDAVAHSGMFKLIGYDQEKKDLRVVYPSNKEYSLQGVPEDVFVRMLLSGSAGKVYHAEVKGKYVETEVASL